MKILVCLALFLCCISSSSTVSLDEKLKHVDSLECNEGSRRAHLDNNTGSLITGKEKDPKKRDELPGDDKEEFLKSIPEFRKYFIAFAHRASFNHKYLYPIVSDLMNKKEFANIFDVVCMPFFGFLDYIITHDKESLLIKQSLRIVLNLMEHSEFEMNIENVLKAISLGRNVYHYRHTSRAQGEVEEFNETILSCENLLSESETTILKLSLIDLGWEMYEEIEKSTLYRNCSKAKEFTKKVSNMIEELNLMSKVTINIAMEYLLEGPHLDLIDPIPDNASKIDAIRKTLLLLPDDHIYECKKFQYQYFIVASNIVAQMIINEQVDGEFGVILEGIKNNLERLPLMKEIKDAHIFHAIFYALDSFNDLQEQFAKNPVSYFLAKIYHFDTLNIPTKSKELLKIDTNFSQYKDKFADIMESRTIKTDILSLSMLPKALRSFSIYFPFNLSKPKPIPNDYTLIKEDLPILLYILYNYPDDNYYIQHPPPKISKELYNLTVDYLTFKAEYDDKLSKKPYTELLEILDREFRDKEKIVDSVDELETN